MMMTRARTLQLLEVPRVDITTVALTMHNGLAGPTSFGPDTDNTLTPTDPDSEGEEELYEVEKLIGCKTMWGEKHYRVKWKDYSIKEATWEPANALPPEIIQEYHIEHISLGRQRKRKGLKR